MPQELIQKRLAALTPEYRDFVVSDFSQMTTNIFGTQLHLGTSGRVIFENGLMLYLLLFLSEYELMGFFISECDIPIITATNLVKTIVGGLPQSMTEVIHTLSLELRTEEKSPVQDKTRDQILGSAQKNKLYFYLYTTAGNGLISISQKYNFREDEVYKKFAITVGDIILGFYNIEDTVPLLQQELRLDPRTAALLGADVLEFLAPLSDPNWQPPEGFEPIDSEEEDSELSQIPVRLKEVVEQNRIAIQPILPNIPTPATPFDTTRVTPDIAPYVAPVVPPLRTMADDMTHPAEQREGLVGGLNYEPVYTSSQDNLRRPISDTPNYVTPIPPRPPQNQNRPSVEEPPRWGG